MEDIYQKPLDIRTSETDFTGCMRPGALLTAFQEAAEHHAMRLGCGFEVHGNFVALDPADYGVREWSFYILGVEVASGSRDSSASTAS